MQVGRQTTRDKQTGKQAVRYPDRQVGMQLAKDLERYAGREAGRQSEIQTGSSSSLQGGREAGKQPAPDRQSGWEADEHARDPYRLGDGQ
jgi:hypothetical protein